MSVAYPVQGDAEAAVISILRSDSSVAAFSPTRISSDAVGYQKGNLWVQVTRQGGNIQSYVVDKPRIDINVYGPDRTTAHDLAQVVQSVLLNSRGYRGNGISISDVRVETGIFRTNDLLTDSPRYIFALRLTVTPRG